MKKGYIFSWYNYGRNFGQTLQAYALQKALSNMGFFAEHVCFDTNRSVTDSIISRIKDFFSLTRAERNSQKEFDSFIRNYMKTTVRLNEDSAVRRYIAENKPDFLICGSDQIWNPFSIHPFYFLAEIGDEHTNKVAYAVSTCDVRRKYRFMEYPEIEKWVKKINHVFVRENSGKEIFSELYNLNTEVVLDPTLLLSATEWIQQLQLKKSAGGGYIFCYSFNLSETQKRIIEDRAKLLKCAIVYGYETENESVKAWSPRDFVEAILNAEEVFTDSFHGTVFSILFQKSFYVFDNGKDLNSDPYYNIDRMNTLLKLIGLEKRLLTDPTDCGTEMIDYDKVDVVLKKKRKECISLLRESLG